MIVRAAFLSESVPAIEQHTSIGVFWCGENKCECDPLVVRE